MTCHIIGKGKEFPSPFGVRVLKLSPAKEEYIESVLRFPSPFGVRVLKYEEWRYYHFGEYEFPSPFGVRVLKLYQTLFDISISYLFPSPFGVRVLKFKKYKLLAKK